jgi:N6-adenosine-specific RNA methylase IME4
MPNRGRPRLYATKTDQMRAYRQRRKQRQQAGADPLPPLPPGPYSVLYCDPPWRYFGLNPVTGDQVDRGAWPQAAPVATLMALPIQARVRAPALLFLWSPAPLLMASLAVMDAWGFRYRSHWVWDTMRPHQTSRYPMQHVLLLIGTRGRWRYSVWAWQPSLYRIVGRSDVAKPDSFRARIDEVVQYIYGLRGLRLELFARHESTGWHTWPVGWDATVWDEPPHLAPVAVSDAPGTLLPSAADSLADREDWVAFDEETVIDI